MKTEAFFRHPLGMALSVIAATFLWGSAFPVIKLSYQYLEIGPNEVGEQILFAGYRFFLAGIFIMAFYALIGKKADFKIQKSSLSTILTLAVLMTFLQYFFFYIGLSRATGVQGSIIAGTASFFQIIFAHFLLKNDRLSMQKVTGLCIGFSGVLLAYIPQGAGGIIIGVGELFVLTSTIVGAYGNIVTKKAFSNWSVHYLTSYGMILGSSMLLILGMFMTDFTFFSFALKEAFMLIYLAFLSAAGFLLWNNALKYNSVSKVSVFNFLIPVFGVLLSGIFLGEEIGLSAIVGLALVALGIITVNGLVARRRLAVEKSVSADL
ncbi:MAG: DMT family transporter [Bacillus sp. (in: firmicutes)]